MQESKCKYCGASIGRTENSPWVHADLLIDGSHKPQPVESNLVDLHNRITDLLMECFIPQNKEFDTTSNNLVRRGLSSVTEDIMRLVEDHYGLESS